ncbi:hypothetical protein EJ08DRAFT_272422 [Tothia fuscella]|uniref:Metallo-beta-lactamase domain-containing protein n=1 Tax=Tothia fuscella TaxID=1048955 RepID=A0A9P4NPI8_9PEZI|nr:hypothetical protein EJ08DRAFT_272422 [Tothia fuscella]
MAAEQTIEWFGATTFRFKTNGLTIFLDTWLERLSNIETFLTVDQVEECDYIFISHAHFDQLPDADRLAKKTGAIIIANGEAINVVREAGVPDEQLLPVASGERIPLFTKEAWEESRAAPKPDPPKPGPQFPPSPDPSKAAIAVHAYPSLHCLMPGGPGEHPEITDTATEYNGSASPYSCTVDITMGMKYGLLAMAKAPEHVRTKMPEFFQSFLKYIADDKNKFSHLDGGHMMFNFIIGDQTLLYMSHLGGYTGVLQQLQPKPDTIIMGIAGRGNIDGRPFDGSAAQCATNIVKWLGEKPKKIIWCLHDQAPIPPWHIKTEAMTKQVEAETGVRIWDLEHARVYKL